MDAPNLTRILELPRVALDIDPRRALQPLKSRLTPRDAARLIQAVDYRPAIELASALNNFIEGVLEGHLGFLGPFAQAITDAEVDRFEGQSLAIYNNVLTSTPHGQAAVAVILASRPELLVCRDELPQGWLTAKSRQVLLEHRPGGQSVVYLARGEDIKGRCVMRYAPLGHSFAGGLFMPDWRWFLPDDLRHCGHVTYIFAEDGSLRFADINTYLAQSAAEELLDGDDNGIGEQWLREALSFPATRQDLERAIKREGRPTVRTLLVSLSSEWQQKEPDKWRVQQKVVDALLEELNKGLPNRRSKTEVFPASSLSGDRILERVIDSPLRTRTLEDVADQLSPSQRELLGWMSAGVTQEEIARRRGITQSAVSQQLTTIKRKLRKPEESRISQKKSL